MAAWIAESGGPEWWEIWHTWSAEYLRWRLEGMVELAEARRRSFGRD